MYFFQPYTAPKMTEKGRTEMWVKMPQKTRNKHGTETGFTRITGMWFVNGKTSKGFAIGVSYVCDWEDRALQECNLSARSSVDCASIRPGAVFGAGILAFRDATQATVQCVKLIVVHILGSPG
jgi:hypothetical protein